MKKFQEWLEEEHSEYLEEGWARNALTTALMASALSGSGDFAKGQSPTRSGQGVLQTVAIPTKNAMQQVAGKTTYDHNNDEVSVSNNGIFSWQDGVKIKLDKEDGGTGVYILIPTASHSGPKLENRLKFAYMLYKGIPRSSDIVYHYTDEPAIKRTDGGIQKHGIIKRHKIIGRQTTQHAAQAAPQPMGSGLEGGRPTRVSQTDVDAETTREPAWDGVNPPAHWSGKIPSWVTSQMVVQARAYLTQQRGGPTANAEALDWVITQGGKRGLPQY